MAKKLLIVKPFGGIANRLRVISSMIWLKGKLNCRLKVIWLENEELGASYNDLFEAPFDFEVVNSLGLYRYVRTSKQKFLVKRLIARIINKSMGVDYCVFDSDMYKGVDHILDIVGKHDTVFFNTCEELVSWDPGLRAFQLLPTLETRLNELSEKLGIDSNTIGVHVRRTDHTIAANRSPNLLFEDMIYQERNRDPSLKIYLSSDDPQVVEHFKRIFGEMILAMVKKYGRDSKGAIEDGLIELFLLSRTKKIYGSYWSSYSKMAGRLSGINVEILQIGE